MAMPLPYRVTAGNTADIEDDLPQLFHGLVHRQVGEDHFCPRLAGHGGNAPLDLVVHGVDTPLFQRLAAGQSNAVDLGSVQTGKYLGVVGQQVQHTDAALAFGKVQIAAQHIGLDIAERFLAAQLHPGTGNGIIRPVHTHITGAGLEGGTHTGTGQLGGLQRGGNDQGLARLDIHTDADDKVVIFFQQFVVHNSSPCKELVII